jgi:hypothetical protein
MRLTPALSTLALAPLALTALAVGPAPSQAATAQPAPDAIRVTTTGDDGGTSLPDGALAQVATGYWSTYALTLDGRVLAAGSEYGGALDVPASLEDETVVQLDAGYRHGLALDADGDVTTWGWLDDDKTVPATVPQDVQDADLVQVAAGGNHDLALTADGEVLGWGAGSPEVTTIPDEVRDLDVASVHTGQLTSGVITTDGKVLTWGYAGPAPESLSGQTVVALALGDFSALALTADGDLVGWGENFYGELDVPQDVQAADVVAVDLSASGAMAATSDGRVRAWGDLEGASEEQVVPETTGGPVTDVQLDRYRATVVYAALVNDTPPVISGDAVVGSRLTATTGEWDGTPETYRYQWFSDEEPVGTDAASYTPTPADVDHAVTVRVTALEGAASGVATSEAVVVQRRAFTTAPRVSLSGTPRVGQVLTLKVTATAPQPDAYQRTWFREGQVVPYAHGLTYRLTKADLGRRISAVVVAERDGYEDSAGYSPEVTVAPGAATLGVSAPTKAKLGAKIKVTVTGLVAREVYTLRLDGRTLLRSRADSAGRVSRLVTVARSVRVGKRTLAVVGSYADRSGRRTVTVTR